MTEPTAPEIPLLVAPVQLAGPGDHARAFEHLTQTQRTWGRYSPDGGECSVLVRECLTAAFQLDHTATADHQVAWTFSRYESPVGQCLWQATFDTQTPVELVMAFTHSLEYDLERWEPDRRDAAVRGQHGYEPLIELVQDAGWTQWPNEEAVSYRSPDGSAGILLARGADTDPWGNLANLGATYRLWGARPDPGPQPPQRPIWTATFSPAVPTDLLLDTLGRIVEDGWSDPRTRAEVCSSNWDLLEARPAPSEYLRYLASTARSVGLPAAPAVAPPPPAPAPAASTLRSTRTPSR